MLSDNSRNYRVFVSVNTLAEKRETKLLKNATEGITQNGFFRFSNGCKSKLTPPEVNFATNRFFEVNYLSNKFWVKLKNFRHSLFSFKPELWWKKENKIWLFVRSRSRTRTLTSWMIQNGVPIRSLNLQVGWKMVCL